MRHCVIAAESETESGECRGQILNELVVVFLMIFSHKSSARANTRVVYFRVFLPRIT